ncbi:MAG TPA: hypothetical protein VIL71_06270 [Spirillospora sp.]
MSGDDTHIPVHGTAAGDPYIALPPTAVDASATGPTRLIVAWPGFDPPRTGRALAAAMPMTGVPVWRVYLDLPRTSPGGLESGAILRDEAIEAYCEAVEEAVRRLPSALADIRRDLGLPDGPVGLAGFSVGGAVALLAAARDVVPVTTVALVTPVVSPSDVAQAVEQRSGLERSWTDDARGRADRLDLRGLAPDLAGRGIAALLIGGTGDRIVPARDITALRDELRRHNAGPVESTAFRMGHALAAEPGTEAQPPITEAVRVDGVLTDWFRERLATPVPARPGITGHAAAPATTEPDRRADTTPASGDEAAPPAPSAEAEQSSRPAEADTGPGTQPDTATGSDTADAAPSSEGGHAADTEPSETDTGAGTRPDVTATSGSAEEAQPPPAGAEQGGRSNGADAGAPPEPAKPASTTSGSAPSKGAESTSSASTNPKAAGSPPADRGHGAWSLDAGGAPPEAPKTPRGAEAGSGR